MALDNGHQLTKYFNILVQVWAYQYELAKYEHTSFLWEQTFLFLVNTAGLQAFIYNSEIQKAEKSKSLCNSFGYKTLLILMWHHLQTSLFLSE